MPENPQGRENDEHYREDVAASATIGTFYASGPTYADREWGTENHPHAALHEKIYARYEKKIKETRPSAKPILIVTAGAGGAGKTTALEKYLAQLKDPHSTQFAELGQFTGTAAAEDLKTGRFTSLSHDIIKKEMCAEGAVDYLKRNISTIRQAETLRSTGNPTAIRDGLEDRPDLLSSGIHRESSWVMDQIAAMCMEGRGHLVYDIAVTDVDRVMSDEYQDGLFDTARRFGYDVIAITVEASQDQARDGNYKNYLKSADLISKGDPYGITVNPETAIGFAYRDGNTHESVCRGNVQEIADTGRIQRVIRVDHGVPSDMKLQDPRNPEVLRTRDPAQQSALAVSPVTDRTALYPTGANEGRGKTPVEPNIPRPRSPQPPAASRGR